MPRCGNCGKANREGALFCQDCGQRLTPGDGKGEAPSSVSPGAPAVVPVALAGGPARPRVPEGPACPSCGTLNPAGMSFCKMCGTALSAARAPSGGPPQPVAGRVTCAQCGKQTPAGYAFCQHCGHRLGGPPSAVPGPAPMPEPAAAPPGVVAGVIQRPAPTPPAGIKAVPSAAPAGMAPGRLGPPSSAGTAAPGSYYAPPQAVPQSGVPATTVAVHGPGQGLLGRLIAIRRDGSDGDAIPLSGETFDIGRSEGNLCFAEDPFLAPRHARFLAYGGVVRVRPLDLINGVFLRLRDPHELQPGDVFYIGKELLRFETLAAEERDPPSLVEHGVRLFGSAPRESWARLRQITCAGTTRDIWYLSRPEVALGREEGDITFPDDEFMSRRHAILSRAGNRARLVDQNSSNGTYVRLRGDRELRPSDVLRMGDQLLRFEP